MPPIDETKWPAFRQLVEALYYAVLNEIDPERKATFEALEATRKQANKLKPKAKKSKKPAWKDVL